MNQPKRSTNVKLFDKILTQLAAIALVAVALTSCDGMIYDDEGDCAPHYKVKFKYDMNMKFADAFPNEVNSVTLYAVDAATGKIVWQNHESGERLKADGYEMDLPVDPGKYHLMAWAGDGHKTSFTVNEETDHIDGLHCRMNREYESRTTQVAVSDTDLDRLYHGREENLEMPDRQGTHYYTIPLTKDTNVIRVVLQQLSGERMDYTDFDYEITDINGHLESDNTLRGDEKIYYEPWIKKNAIAQDTEYPDEEHITSELGAVIVEFTVSRLMADSNPRLTIRNHETGEKVISIPLMNYFQEILKGEHYKGMEPQEYLDREDEYNMIFFLDEGLIWKKTYIYINSFKVIYQDVEL